MVPVCFTCLRIEDLIILLNLLNFRMLFGDVETLPGFFNQHEEKLSGNRETLPDFIKEYLLIPRS